MADDDVREMRGVRAKKQTNYDSAVSVVIYEQQVAALINMDWPDYDVAMTPAAARSMARCLYRLARRVDQREASNG